MALHSEAVKLGLDSNVLLTNTLVDSYGKSGSLEDAKKVFHEAPCDRTLVSWNALILSYADNGKGRRALELFSSMPFEPSTRTFVAAVRACTTIATENSDKDNIDFTATSKVLELGMAVHSRAVMLGLDLDVFVATSFINMYSKLGSMADSQRAFDRASSRSPVSWNALILGYAENGDAEKSFELFSAMQQDGEVSPDAHTLVAVLKACSKLAAKEKPRQVDGKVVKMVNLERCLAIHSQARELALGRYVTNTLVDCYAKCGSMVDAERVFWKRKEHISQVSWTVMMLGYVENHESEKALLLFETIKAFEDLQRQRITSLLLAALKACSSLADLRATKSIQAQVFRRATIDDDDDDHDHGDAASNTVVSSLIHAFGECSSMIDAQLVFDSFQPPKLDVVSWNSLMAGFSRQGNSKMVFQIFRALQDEQRFHPDGATFLSLLTACNHAGLVLHCKRYFHAMEEFGVIPGIEHYHCVVDLLARANEMEQAVAVLESMPMRATVVTWRSLLAACLKWKNVAIGEFAFQSLMEASQGNDPAGYALVTSLYRSCS
ncbi:pentatricopeptide repeat-containing protein At2g33680-like [Selaginella moellendorffii]|uniref:pentatricopeptide repeat-containing protein At2g33680-like n=1 Tax=Selaginella moellendorffii TaxID=88036 RepID=UPI000D1CD995|nr:pentatricopeptide repeat-containing protein At2g33680-like [Selaginella moellendorffii]|eukprot:XP_024529009.1 pentatricopeptide repeat-containing protein At2g33680-like [Selaginella moellendorffii]